MDSTTILYMHARFLWTIYLLLQVLYRRSTHTHTPPAVRESCSVRAPAGTFSKLENWNERERNGRGMR